MLCNYNHGFKINIYFNRSGSSVPIIITLVTMEQSSEHLLKEVEDEFGKLIEEFDMIVQTVTVTRFG